MRLRPTNATLLLLAGLVALLGVTGTGDRKFIVAWMLGAVGGLASAVAVGVVLVRMARSAREEAHGAFRPLRWWGPVLAAGLLGVAAGAVLAWPLIPPGLPLRSPHVAFGAASLTAAGLAGIAAAAVGTASARDGTRTRAAPVLLRMGLAGLVPGVLLFLAGWFQAMIFPLLQAGALIGFPTIAAYWTSRLRASGPGAWKERIAYAVGGLVLVAVWAYVRM